MGVNNKLILFIFILSYSLLLQNLAFAWPTAPTINVITVQESDIFYSPAAGNNVIHALANITGLYANPTPPINYSLVQFNFANISSTCGAFGAIQNVTSPLANGLYSANCTVTTEAMTSLFIPGAIIITAINMENATIFNSSTYNTTIILYNMTIPSINDASGCTRFGSQTTNLSTEQDFSRINLVLDIEINRSCWLIPNSTGLYTDGALINFSSIDLSTPANAQKLMNLYKAVNITLNMPDSFGSSRVYINSTYFNSLNSSAVIKLFDIPFDSQPHIIQEINGSLNSTSTLNWTQGSGIGNLTFTVNHFSGFNITDNTSPVITLSSPLVFSNTSVIVNITLNGTGTDISSALIYFDASTIANGTNCTQRYTGSELFDCIFPYTITGLSNHNIVVIANDYGGPAPGNSATLNQTIYYDAIPPGVVLNLPSNNSITGGSTTFSFNVTDDRDNNISCLVIIVNTSSQQVYAVNNTRYNYTTILSDGNYLWYVNCSDDAGNINITDTRNLTIDATAPIITLANSVYGSVNPGYYNDIFTINFTAIDTSSAVNNCWWSVDKSANVSLATYNYTNCINITVTLSNLTNGNHTVIIYSNDTFNNIRTTIFTYSMDTITPNVTAGPYVNPSTSTATLNINTSEPTNKSITNCGNTVVISGFSNVSSNVGLSGLTPGGTYYTCTIKFCDRAGNCDQIETDSFSTTGTTSGNTGGGSGGGGGGGGAQDDTSGTADYSWSMVYDTLPNGTETVDVSNNDVLISTIDLTTTVSAYNINFDIERSNTSETPYNPMILTGNELVFGYVTISHANLPDSSITSAVIKFKVEKSWLNSNNVKKENITLLRYSGSGWDVIPSKVLSDDVTFVYYQGTSPGLSLYAITGKETPPAPLKNVTTNKTSPAGNNSNSNSTKGANANSRNVNKSINTSGLSDISSQDQTQEGTSVWVWVVIFAIIVGVLGIFMYIKKLKQDKLNAPAEQQSAETTSPMQTVHSIQQDSRQRYNYAQAPIQPQNKQYSYGQQQPQQPMQGRPQQIPNRPANAPATPQRTNQAQAPYRNSNYNYNNYNNYTNYNRNMNANSKKQSSNSKK